MQSEGQVTPGLLVATTGTGRTDFSAVELARINLFAPDSAGWNPTDAELHLRRDRRGRLQLVFQESASALGLRNAAEHERFFSFCMALSEVAVTYARLSSEKWSGALCLNRFA
jgi:hypothetical protein